ncbi:hypothetical protein J8F10_22200 [Gemmata sp. G18]|uniref:HEPN domain-containing protein n=1 Tax=Gemmata palustris TaxID=2822762 RepID=A0ABS5BW70_9BACT|nr:hypothetical protein [Gemmata palustris]MBP3957976.1 hypothetical protein [Gemmata palustris]
MSAADELLAVAHYLLRQNNKQPTDAAIRRAVSTAYYALFHRLIEAATSSLVLDPRQRPLIARSFDHGRMRKVCEGMKAPPVLVAALLGAPVPDELKRLAATFVDLQDRRHDADYNLGKVLAKSEARDSVAQAQEAFAHWNTVQPMPISGPFLSLLLHGEPKSR